MRHLQFQFHKGTIKTLSPMFNSNILRNFNSIKVRLKRDISYYDVLSYLFQFHKGTIKTGYNSTAINIAYVFQFHKGTIKTE